MWTEKDFDEQIRKIENEYEHKEQAGITARENGTSIGSITANDLTTIQQEGTRNDPLPMTGRAGTADVKFRPGEQN